MKKAPYGEGWETWYPEPRNDWEPSRFIEDAYEAEEQVPEEEYESWCNALEAVTLRRGGEGERVLYRRALFHATPLQRAKALLIWKKRTQ